MITDFECFVVMFSYQYFYMTHLVLKDLLTTNDILDENFNKFENILIIFKYIYTHMESSNYKNLSRNYCLEQQLNKNIVTIIFSNIKKYHIKVLHQI